jgi:hypothetical protein
MIKVVFFCILLLSTSNCIEAIQNINSNSVSTNENAKLAKTLDGYRQIDVNSLATLMDFCFAHSLKVAFQSFYSKFTDSPGKLMTAERQVVQGAKYRLRYSKILYIVEI